jgi:acyl-coenzyme A thioesterase PaaI-like protein
MNIQTHLAICKKLCGEPVIVSAGQSRVCLTTTPVMAADDAGLVHGGFIFGMADYAAMLAVNHPNVVLGGAQTTFTKPVRVGEALEAHAVVQEESGRRRRVEVTVYRSEDVVFTGVFQCHVLDKHVLA